MRKLFSFNMVTLDGFFEGPNQDISWHNVDAEFNEFAIEQTGAGDTLVFGRVTYQLMASYWPTPYNGPRKLDTEKARNKIEYRP